MVVMGRSTRHEVGLVTKKSSRRQLMHSGSRLLVLAVPEVSLQIRLFNLGGR